MDYCSSDMDDWQAEVAIPEHQLLEQTLPGSSSRYYKEETRYATVWFVIPRPSISPPTV